MNKETEKPIETDKCNIDSVMPCYTEATQNVYHCLSCMALEEIDCVCDDDFSEFDICDTAFRDK